MTQVDRQPVTFQVTAPTADNIPAGNYSGYIDWITIYLAGHSKRSMARCMLHVERSDAPALFSSGSAKLSMDVDVLSDVKKGVITYDG